jgi:hypothetical protein
MADRFAPRVVLALAMSWRAIFAGATAAIRLLFGAGEAATFPAGPGTLVACLPMRQRAIGQGFQHSGARLGAISTWVIGSIDPRRSAVSDS